VSTSASAWIFQAQPREWDVDAFLADVAADRVAPDLVWMVTQHATEIAPDDRVFVWRAGARPGVLALARVAGPVAWLPADHSEYRCSAAGRKFDGERRRVPLTLERILAHPLTSRRLRREPDTAGLSILRSAEGTNFPVDPAEQIALERLAVSN
jgi:hypothetical protein